MVKILLIACTFLLFSSLSAQEENLDVSDPTSSLYVDDFAYTRFIGREEHSAFIVRYQITDNLQAELHGFYDTYLFSNRFRSSFAFKKYVSKKFYLFAGAEIEIEMMKDLRMQPRPPRLGVISGFGYDVNSNFSLEAKSNIGINQTSMGAFGEPIVPMPQVYTLGGRIRF